VRLILFSSAPLGELDLVRGCSTLLPALPVSGQL
jgi:hypothetical protein